MIWIVVIWGVHRRRLHVLLAGVSEIGVVGGQAFGRDVRDDPEDIPQYVHQLRAADGRLRLSTRCPSVAIEELGELISMDSSRKSAVLDTKPYLVPYRKVETLLINNRSILSYFIHPLHCDGYLLDQGH